MTQAPGHFLVLYPSNPRWAPESLDAIAQALLSTGLVGEKRDDFLFSAGPNYLNLVTYLGCSPQIALGENEAATTICLSGILDSPEFQAGTNLKSPRCPQCRKTVQAPETVGPGEQTLSCNHCGYSGRAYQYDWRRTAAYGRVFIEISNVFESEAVPGEELTDCLLKATGEVWDYSYIRRA